MSWLDSLPDFARRAYNAVNEVVADTADAINDVVESAVDAAGRAADQAGEKAAELAEQFSQAAADAATKVEQLSEEGKRKVAGAAQEAREGAEKLAAWGEKRIDKLADDASQALEQAERVVETAREEIADVVSAEADAARRHIAGAAGNALDQRKCIYLNVGCWSGDSSDFGLVCGRWAALCSWLSPGTPLLPNVKDAEDARAREKILSFLNGAPHKPSLKRYERALTPLTENNDLLVFVGDLHVNLFKESLCDNFVYDSRAGRASLAEEFKKFIEHAARHTGEPANERIIQAGDCFEIWEAQIVMRLACRAYREAVKTPGPERDERLNRIVSLCALAGLPVKGAELDAGRMNQAFRNASTPALAAGILGTYSSTPADQFNAPLDFTDPSLIEERIKQAFKEIPWSRFNQLRGNHDNNLVNKRLRGEFASCGGDAPRDEPPKTFGRENCIAAEHGHSLDAFNNPHVFDSPNRGFDSTDQWVQRELKISNMFDCLMMDGKSRVADKGLIEFTRARAAELAGLIASENSTDNQPFRLIVLGHSHAADLDDSRTLGASAEAYVLRKVTPSVPTI